MRMSLSSDGERMSLSSDGRYYHGRSTRDGYVFVETGIVDISLQEWSDIHPRAPVKIRANIELLHHTAEFWDLSQREGAHNIQEYLFVEHSSIDKYKVSRLNRKGIMWDYVATKAQLEHWLIPITRIIQTSVDPLCGVYSIPELHVPLWDVQ